MQEKDVAKIRIISETAKSLCIFFFVVLGGGGGALGVERRAMRSGDGAEWVGTWYGVAPCMVRSGSVRGKQRLGTGYGAVRRGVRNGCCRSWGGRAYD